MRATSHSDPIDLQRVPVASKQQSLSFQEILLSHQIYTVIFFKCEVTSCATCNSPQPQVKESVSKFMAYVHMSVNQTSKEYLANERRYNYTTPKSFLELIKLYHSLLGQKSKDLTTKMERLENGLQKLKSTSTQVLTFILVSVYVSFSRISYRIRTIPL